MVQKIPPPPLLASRDQALNRWLLELTALLNSTGGIDPGNVTGLPAAIAQVGVNTANIATLNGEVATNTANIATNTASIAVNTANIGTLNGEVTTLQANGVLLNGAGAPAAGLGKVGDWYGNLGGGVGARIYIKTGVATWSAFPF